MKFKEIFLSFKGEQAAPTLTREKIFSVLGAFVAILALMAEIYFASSSIPLKVLVLASMGASTCLVFAVSHSPMAQPWPIFGGHLLAASVGVACAQWIPVPAFAVATAVALAIGGMYFLRCLHPPSAGTAMIAILGGPAVHELGWQFCYVVAINAGTILLLALLINNLIPGRRYPLRHTHHQHHQQFMRNAHKPYPELNEEDFGWALGRMDGVIDVSREDLVDLYEFAVEHAQQHRATMHTGGKPQ